MNPGQEMDELWRTAEAQRDAGQSPLRVIRPAYSLPPGDGEISARAWLTDAESDRVYELQLQIQGQQSVLASQAHARLLAKHALRRSLGA